MERPEDEKGTVMIRTCFGEVAAAYWFPKLSLAELVTDEEWRAAVQAEGGPFCHTDSERLLPF